MRDDEVDVDVDGDGDGDFICICIRCSPPFPGLKLSPKVFSASPPHHLVVGNQSISHSIKHHLLLLLLRIMIMTIPPPPPQQQQQQQQTDWQSPHCHPTD